MATYNYVATNGADYTATTDAIATAHKEQADAWFAEHGAELFDDYEDRMVSYGQDYYYDGGLIADDDNEVSVADDLTALHDLTTDDMDVIELHGQTYLQDLQCYREIGTGSQAKRARELVNMDTRATSSAEMRAERATQVRRHLKLDRPSRGEVVAAGIIKSQKRTVRTNNRMARKVAAAEARAK